MQSFRIDLLKAEVLRELGDYPAALAVLAALPPGGPEFATLRARRLKEQAWISFYLGKYDEAGMQLDDAEKEAQKTVPVKPGTLSDIAYAKLYLYGQTGDLDAARTMMNRLDRGSVMVDKPHLLGTYAWVLGHSARFEEAATYYELALAGGGLASNPVEEAKFNNNLAEIYYQLGDSEQALNAARKAEPALRRSDPSGLRQCLTTMGLIYRDRGELPKAQDFLQRAQAIATDLKEESSMADGANNLALIAIQNGNWLKAEGLIRSAAGNESHRKYIESQQYSLILKARILAGENDLQDALSTLDTVTAQRLTNPNSRLQAEVEYLAIYRRLRDSQQARAHYRTARTLIDAVRSAMQKDENKLAWYDSQSELNQEWVRFLVETDHPGEALESVEQSRALLMFERLGKAGHSAGRIRDYQAIARSEDAALVSYWLMPEFSYAWVVTADRVEMRKLPGEHQIASLVARYQSFLEDGNDPLTSDNKSGADLRAAILDPILPFLPNAKRVILVPDAQLNALNFETLPVNGHYWIQDVGLTLAPSLNILDARPQAASSPSILAVGDPTPTLEFPKLPSAAREIDNVVGTFAASTVLRGSEATPAAYMNAIDGQTYIHFAAHAASLADQPLDSAVILSSGRLTARDLLRKPMHAELVTLSACRSAGVRSYHGEGLVGLAWVFLQTGAQGVIAGLWDASDDTTAHLMTTLYKGIARGEKPESALREAKLQLIASNSPGNRPYYWGPFQYYRGASH